LRGRGINPNLLSAKGRGETHPAAPNDTATGRAQNRRIEIAVEAPGR
jgi:flagellar motor protein MotB